MMITKVFFLVLMRNEYNFLIYRNIYETYWEKTQSLNKENPYFFINLKEVGIL